MVFRNVVGVRRQTYMIKLDNIWFILSVSFGYWLLWRIYCFHQIRHRTKTQKLNKEKDVREFHNMFTSFVMTLNFVLDATCIWVIRDNSNVVILLKKHPVEATRTVYLILSVLTIGKLYLNIRSLQFDSVRLHMIHNKCALM